ncbi:MAG: hypothetical protein VW270_26460, partial [Candidatus Poseidoniales archaeon]
MADVIVAFQGWNSSNQGWGEAGWGESVPLADGTGQVGSVSITADANVSVTGVSSTASVGSVTVTADANVSPTGVSATGSIGSVTVTG